MSNLVTLRTGTIHASQHKQPSHSLCGHDFTMSDFTVPALAGGSVNCGNCLRVIAKLHAAALEINAAIIEGATAAEKQLDEYGENCFNSAMSDRQQLMRLLDHAYAVTRHIDSSVSAEELYTDAARVAEQRIPGAIGIAVAGMLAVAAESRRISGVRGNLGEHTPMLALAVAVLESAVDVPSAGDRYGETR